MNRKKHRSGFGGAKALLVASVCLNLALAAAAFHLFSKPVPVAPVLATGPVVVSIRPQVNAMTNPVAAISYLTNRFHWRLIESTNYDDYVANLRGIECPEKTVRDIILADVEKLYAARKRGLELNQPFWMGGKQRRDAMRQMQLQSEAMEQEQLGLIRRLLGEDVCADNEITGHGHIEEQALARFICGPMLEEHFQKAAAIGAKYDKLRAGLSARSQGITTEDDEVEMRKLGAAIGRELAGVLSPMEFEEMAARVASIQTIFKNDLLMEAVQLTPAEVRAIYLAKARSHEFAVLFDFEGTETREQTATREAAFTNAVAQLLGPERFADFERAQDGNFRVVFEFAKDNSLPKSTAVAVYELRKVAAEEVRRIRDDTTLDEAARRQRFEEIQLQMRTTVSGALGQTVCEQYLSRGGGWVTNAASL